MRVHLLQIGDWQVACGYPRWDRAVKAASYEYGEVTCLDCLASACEDCKIVHEVGGRLARVGRA